MKKVILGFIIGILVCGVVGVSAYNLLAKDIAYKDTNVEDAIDDLYDKVAFPINGYIKTSTADDLRIGGGATKANGSITLTSSGDFQWGAHKDLTPGCYLIMYNGDNLNGDLTYDAVGSKGNIQYPTVYKMNDYAFYTINIPADDANFEFRLWKTSNSGITKVNSISIFSSNNC